MCIFGPHEPGLPAWGQEELKPGGLQGGGALWVPRQSGEHEQEPPKWLPVPFSSPARDPTGHSLLSPSWAGSRAMPTPHCGRGRGRTGGRAARRSELCVHAGPSAGEVLTPNGGGGEEGQRRPCFPGREPRTIEPSCPTARMEGNGESPATPTAAPGDGPRLAPPRTRKSLRPAGQGLLGKKAPTGKMGDLVVQVYLQKGQSSDLFYAKGRWEGQKVNDHCGHSGATRGRGRS